MNARRAEAAEEWLGWLPLPHPPLLFRPSLAAAGRALADYREGDRDARRRLAAALDRIVLHPRFPAAPSEFRLLVLLRAALAHNWCGVGESNDDELVRARELLVDGIRSARDTGPERAWLEYALANTLVNQYQRASLPDLLAEALVRARRSVACAGTDPRLAALCRCGLASILEIGFRTDGDPQKLSEAVEHAEWAVATAGDTPLGHRFRYVLASELTTRYDARGNLDDLERAVELLRRAALSRDYTMAPRTGNAFHGTLAGLLRRQYLRTRNAAVLDEAVRLLTVEVGDDDYRADPISLTNLGNVLLTRYQAYGDPADLIRAVDLQLKTLEVREESYWQLASAHNNAGNALAAAWRTTGNPELGRQAATHYRHALARTTRNAPERASRAYNLAVTLQDLAAADDNSPDTAAEVSDVYREAVRAGLGNALEWALPAARRWGSWAARRGCWEEACEAYTGGLEAAGQLFRLQLQRDAKEAWLAESQGLPTEAAHALFRAGRPVEAITTLEAGRSLLLSEALETDRSSLGRLADSGHVRTADDYRAATAALDEAMRGGAAPDVLREHRAVVDELVERIRSLDGFRSFLPGAEFADITRAVPPGTVVVYLAAAETGGVALVTDRSGRVAARELPAMTAAAVRQRVTALHRHRTGRPGSLKGALDAVTRWAWTAVADPVLSLAGDCADIVLVPSGALAMLPLHAAWRPEPGAPGGRHYLLDERTVRYVPNARALGVTREVAERTTVIRAAVVADPVPTSLPRIGYAAAEAAWAARWFPERDVLLGEAAGIGTVTAALARAQVHHFVCHGLARPDSPLDSALVMAGDQELTLRRILDLRLLHPDTGAGVRLSVLSACDTDRPGTALPDEVISLPTGLIQAGAAGVVASQWVVRSEAVSLLTARFYQLWRTGQQEPAVALRNAQRWLRDTTNREKIRDLAPVPGGPVGGGDEALHALVRSMRLRDPDARPYLHPVDWAGLSFHGT
ncbi:CHAT domain-containing protein [Kitasatospora phosalacinea]|uniref:CHAT domain-containing protein n=1 Tax=Kitasatospora phosalacinea TaxID=2065 RepID=UPI0036670FA4